MARDSPSLIDFEQNHVAITVKLYFLDSLNVSGFLAFPPDTRSRP
jgi:hypothetical protein